MDPSDRTRRGPSTAAPTQDGFDTTAPGADPDSKTLVPGDGAHAVVTLPPHGYRIGHAIGRGGMGEVFAAYDERIGREVAVKRMQGAQPDQEATARFLREARIQARLDHPAVVPVHELAIDARGRLYFTMKRVTGRTLAHRMADGSSLNRLLRAFVEVCLAVEFAHARGVIHRDLKPANIMLGDYGEVYVLDWGIARVVSEPLVEAAPAGGGLGVASSLGIDAADLDSVDPRDEASSTQTGALLGTPGYIAPEQVKGDPASPASDVYSLGSILFELLAGESLHPQGHQRAIASTITQPQELPSRRRPDRAIPPELDAICHAALSEDPAERPTALLLSDQVQAYLDGDRDLERRRVLAEQQLGFAEDALHSGAPDAHTTALRRASRALALDPESTPAAELVSSLLLEPPDAEMPRELAESLEEHERQINRDRSRKALYAYLSVFALLPVVIVLEVKSWSVVAAFFSVLGIAVFTTWRNTRTGRPSIPVVFATNLALAILFTRIAGPFVLTPLLICCVLSGLTSIPWFNERTWAVVAWTLAAVFSPLVLEWTGVLPRTWNFGDAGLVISGDMFGGGGRDTAIALVVASAVFTTVVGLLALAISRRRRLAQRQLYIRAWWLRQLIPSTGRPARPR
ncbi:MAG: serine/threonine-protein kinase [Kofleriaceae bacterium]